MTCFFFIEWNVDDEYLERLHSCQRQRLHQYEADEKCSVQPLIRQHFSCLHDKMNQTRSIYQRQQQQQRQKGQASGIFSFRFSHFISRNMTMPLYHIVCEKC